MPGHALDTPRTRSPRRLVAYACVGLLVLVAGVLVISKLVVPVAQAEIEHNSDPRAYAGSSTISLNQDLATDHLKLPGGVTGLRFKSPDVLSPYSGEFLLTFTVSKSGLAQFFALNPVLAGPRGSGLSDGSGVQPDVMSSMSSVGWVLPVYSPAVYGSGGDFPDGARGFEMSIDERAASTATVYYFSNNS